MKKTLACALLFLSSGFALTREQKLLDFQSLAALYAKNYGPYEWKRDVIKFDLLNLRSWLDRVSSSKDDLEFLDICIEYVAALDDAHDVFTIPSDFIARLNFGVDLYDGKALVEGINRTRLPLARYPINIGDELVSIDGVAVEQLLTSLNKYAIAANARSTRRIAANYLTVRPQTLIPRAIDVPDESLVVFRSASGEEKPMTLPWTKTGTPMTSVGPVPFFPGLANKTTPKSARAVRASVLEDGEPSYMEPMRKIQNASLTEDRKAILGFGSRNPYFAPPDNFQQRLGRVASDFFFSGTFEAGGLRLGFIRIPSFSPSSSAAAIAQFATEIRFFQANTDGLIIDDTRNPGGSVCYLEALVSYLIPTDFRVVGFELRATSNWVASFSSALESAKAQGAEQWVIDQYTFLLDLVKQANSANRGKTGPMPLCTSSLITSPAKDRDGNVLAYTKPIMVLADDLSASGGDVFPAVLQDNKRAIVFGYRTMGAGGTVVNFFEATPFSEGDTSITMSQMNRKDPIVVSDFPTSYYIENVGVRPDVEYDYMTRENLMTNGSAFVRAFTNAMVDYVKSLRGSSDVSEQ